MNPPTQAALKTSNAIMDIWKPDVPASSRWAVGQLIDALTELPALTTIALAAQAVVDAGRPHTSGPVPGYPDGCGCEACEAWDVLKMAVERPTGSLRAVTRASLGASEAVSAPQMPPCWRCGALAGVQREHFMGGMGPILCADCHAVNEGKP